MIFRSNKKYQKEREEIIMFLLFRISNMADGKIRKSIYEMTSKDEAIGNMYTYLGTDIKDENVLSTLVYVEETNGNVIEKHYWQMSPSPEEPTEEVVTE